MQIPQFFDRTNFSKIPTDPGIYAFFLNFEFILRTIKARAAPTTDLTPFIAKAIRAHKTANPKPLGINLFGRTTFTSILELEATHEIKCGPTGPGLVAADMTTIAGILDKCTILSGPLYIGITEKQNLRVRFRQHKKKYERLKKSLVGAPKPKGRDMFTRGGRFYHRLVRRQIEFRDLLFGCIPLSAAEIAHVDYVEKFLHALVAPVMSDAH
jgi:hypothetical protein